MPTSIKTYKLTARGRITHVEIYPPNGLGSVDLLAIKYQWIFPYQPRTHFPANASAFRGMVGSKLRRYDADLGTDSAIY